MRSGKQPCGIAVAGSPAKRAQPPLPGMSTTRWDCPESFGHLRDLKPGDEIIVLFKNTSEEIHYTVVQNLIYNKREANDPDLRAMIFSAEHLPPMALSHLALITCTGYIINGEYNGFRVDFCDAEQLSTIL